MRLEFLWTDQWFLFLLLVACFVILNASRKEHVRRSLTLIVQNSMGASAGIVILFFLTIAVLDSIHIRQADDHNGFTPTILDILMAPTGVVYEKTYSKPLALTSYSSQTVMRDGQAKQVYPRLKYINPHLNDKSDRNALIRQSLNKALIAAMMFSVFVLIFIFLLRRLSKGHFNFKLKPATVSVLLTLFVLSLLVFFCYNLSRDLHVLGTGKIGQDIFYYSIKSIRTGLIIGLLTTLFMMPLALLLGVAAGYFGGLWDDIIQYVYTTLSSIPGVLLITASVLSMQTYIANHPAQFDTLAKSADARLLALCLILGVTSWTSLCRLIRAESLKLREVDFVLAAKALGSSSWTILRKHLLPNVMHIVLITLVLDFSFLVLAEAVLAYVGVGVSPLTISWGNMINGARLELAREPLVWWPMMSAFVFMFILVLASNLFADVVRDAFDPRRV